MAFDRFKLEKLTIRAFASAMRSDPAILEFKAMFNPASYSQEFPIEWARQTTLGSSEPRLTYACSQPRKLSLDLVLDGTGVDQIGALATKSVKGRVDQLLHVAFRYNDAIREANYLRVMWGDLDFACRLSSLTVNYSKFDRDGTPLRAEVKITLLSDESIDALKEEDGKGRADLTQARIVKSGDTLPLLTKEIYGSSASYMDVARYNGLDHFRNLPPGLELVFPPLAALGAGRPGGR